MTTPYSPNQQKVNADWKNNQNTKRKNQLKIKIIGRYAQDELQNGDSSIQKVMAQIIDPHQIFRKKQDQKHNFSTQRVSKILKHGQLYSTNDKTTTNPSSNLIKQTYNTPTVQVNDMFFQMTTQSFYNLTSTTSQEAVKQIPQYPQSFQQQAMNTTECGVGGFNMTSYQQFAENKYDRSRQKQTQNEGIKLPKIPSNKHSLIFKPDKQIDKTEFSQENNMASSSHNTTKLLATSKLPTALNKLKLVHFANGERISKNIIKSQLSQTQNNQQQQLLKKPQLGALAKELKQIDIKMQESSSSNGQSVLNVKGYYNMCNSQKTEYIQKSQRGETNEQNIQQIKSSVRNAYRKLSDNVYQYSYGNLNCQVVDNQISQLLNQQYRFHNNDEVEPDNQNPIQEYQQFEKWSSNLLNNSKAFQFNMILGKTHTPELEISEPQMKISSCQIQSVHISPRQQNKNSLTKRRMEYYRKQISLQRRLKAKRNSRDVDEDDEDYQRNKNSRKFDVNKIAPWEQQIESGTHEILQDDDLDQLKNKDYSSISDLEFEEDEQLIDDEDYADINDEDINQILQQDTVELQTVQT